MDFINIISEQIILPVSDLILGQSTAKNLDFLQKSQWWSENELVEYQNEKLRQLIAHSYENVPFYNELFKKTKLKITDIKSIDDLYKIPIITKQDIRINGKKMVATNIPKSQFFSYGSSGSTGEPLHYFITKKAYSLNIAGNLRGWYWMGYQLGDLFAKLSQNPRKSIIKKFQDFVTRNKYLYAQQLTNENLKKIVEILVKKNPKIIRGYPDPLFFLSRYVQDNNIFSVRPKAINTTGNILFPENRLLIEEQFDCKVFDSYSCEGTANLFECPTHNCYHSTMEYGISEILNNDDENCRNGERGRLISTDLTNYIHPFIRYENYDILIKSDQECSCGRKLLPIKKIEGRNNDILITPKGKYLIVHNFTGYFQQKEVQSVLNFQVLQEKIDEIKLNLVVKSSFNSSDEKKIRNYWENYINDGVKITIDVVNEIPLTASGKRRFLIRNSNIKLNL